MERQSTFSSHLSRQSTRSSIPNIFSDDNGYSLDADQSYDESHRSLIHGDADRDPSGGYEAETPRRSTSTGQGPPHVGTQSRHIGREHMSQQPTRQSSMVSHLSRSHSMASVSDEGALSLNPRRSIRSSSSFGVTRAQSPYQGATGPSHPYALYAQHTGMSRTASIATTSTLRRPERTYSGPRGPTQPYNLYPQNTVDEDDDDDPFDDSNRVLEASYPAGSRPAPRAHHRRLGPDGEDIDDLIGPDGYAEQLPPYTRYPNDIPPKQSPDAANYPDPSYVPLTSSAVAQAVPNSSSSPTSQAAGSDETLHNRTASNDNIYVSHTLARTLSQNPFGNQITPSSSTTAVEATTSQQEKGNLTESARGRSKKRVCWGLMPCWLLAALVSFLVAIIIGAIIGGVLAHKSGVRKGAQNVSEAQTSPSPSVVPVTTVTSILPAQTPEDAAPLQSNPAHLPSVPTGSYAVTLDNPSTTSNSCITDPQMNNAWDCATGAILQVDIEMTTLNNAPTPYINIQYPGPPRNTPIRYGAQPPELLGPTDLILMRDRSAFNRGPAWTFQQPFNKTVVVREQDFPYSIPNTPPPPDKRDLGSKWLGLAADLIGLSKRQTGVNQSDFDQNLYAGPTDRPWFCFWNGTYLDGFIYVYDQAADTSTAAAAPSSSPAKHKRQDNPRRPPYPKTIKIEERRDVLPSQAYCQQFQILDNWVLGKVARPDGTPNIVNIDEDESDQASTIHQAKIHNGGSRLRRALFRSRDITNEGNMCECSWGNS